MLDKILEKGHIELLKSSSHCIEKCRAFRRQILQLVNEGKITLDEEDIEESD